MRFDELHVGQALPDFDLEVTASVVVAGALASRDFMPVHHDHSYAKKQGAPDIFMNIMTTNGYMSRYITDWAGPTAVVRKIAIRLGGPAIPGLTLHFTGAVAALDRATNTVEVAVSAVNKIAEHASGTVAFTLP